MHHRNRWRTWLNWISVACFVLSAPCILFGALGLLGIVADMSPAENRQVGFGFMMLALIPIGLGVIALAVGLLLRRSE